MNFDETNINQWLLQLKKENDKDPMENVSFDMSIEIDEKVHKKIMYWINKSDFEVSGIGKVVVDKERNIIRIIDAILVKQKNGSVSTDLDAAAVGKAMFQLKDTPGELKWWWHSHVNMSVFWSGTDKGTIKQLGMGGWFCATVFNKKNEMKSAFVQSAPIRLVVDDINTLIDNKVDAELASQWDKEYSENVIEKDYSVVSNNSWDRNIVREYHSTLWSEEEDDNIPRVKAVEQIDEDEENDDEEEDATEEYTDRLDALYEMRDDGKISYKELQVAIELLNKEYEFSEDNDADNNEEEQAMDLSSIEEEEDKRIKFRKTPKG